MGSRDHRSAGLLLLGSLAVGAAVGVGSLAVAPDMPAAIVSSGTDVAVAPGIRRQREPQAGDYWRECDEARAAGTAPIYAGEPGYRDGMDGENDGIACEPYRGH